MCDEYLLTASETNQTYSACLWDYSSLNSERIYRNGGIIAPKTLSLISNDYIISSEQNKPLLHLWQLNSQEPSKSTRLILPEPATCLAVCPKNTFLAIGIGTKLYIWHIPSGKLLSIQQKNFQPITCVAFSNDADFLVVAGQDGILLTYTTGSLVVLHNNYLSQSDIGQVEPLYTRNDHSMPIRDISIGSFGRKSRLVSVSADQTAHVYNLATGELLLNLTFEEALTSVVLSATCWELYIGMNSGKITQYDLKTPPRHLVHHVQDDGRKDFIGHSKSVVCLSVNVSNTILASGSEDCFVYTWEIRSRQILKKIEQKSAITNVKFVLNHANFSAEIYKPKVVVKSLERSLDLESDNFSVSLVQDYDIELSDDEDGLEKCKVREDLMQDNVRLRVVNRQLYNAALDISKKYLCK